MPGEKAWEAEESALKNLGEVVHSRGFFPLIPHDGVRITEPTSGATTVIDLKLLQGEQGLSWG